MQVLIIGGYGTFGFNIAKLLAGEKDLTITLAGRNLHKAKAASAQLAKDSHAQFLPLRLDRSQPLAPQIDRVPDVIIDATGPFQSFQGEQRDIVINYALSTKCHYMDLSDDTDFIRHIAGLDDAAKAAGITALSGLSTYPVLTSCVARELHADIPHPTHLVTGIAPSPKARLGRNVLAAILNTAGRKKIYARNGGVVKQAYGLLDTHWRTIAPPQEDPLRPLLFAQVDSPEAVFFDDIESLTHIKNYAGPQPIWMMRVLILFSHLAKFKLFPPLRLFTNLFHGLHHRLTFGDHRSGYFVSLSNQTQRAEFHLTAEGDDGPLIPAMPAAIMIKNWNRNAPSNHGARCAGKADISFDDYANMFARFNIRYGTSLKKLSPISAPVYRQFLGKSFDALPTEIQSLHDIDVEKTYHGKANIIRGTNPLGHIVSWVFGFPKAGQDIDVTIRRVPLGDNLELWERNFNGRKMRSTQAAGRGAKSHMIKETFGPVAVHFAYYKEGDKYHVDTRSWQLFGLPMPRFLCPGGDVYEQGKDGKFHFHVQLCVPLIGMLVTYIGWFDPRAKLKPK